MNKAVPGKNTLFLRFLGELEPALGYEGGEEWEHPSLLVQIQRGDPRFSQEGSFFF